MVRLTAKGHLRPGPSIHISLCKRFDSNAGDSAEYLDRLPPTDRRTDGEEKSMGGRVPQTPDDSATGRLGGLVSYCHCGA